MGMNEMIERCVQAVRDFELGEPTSPIGGRDRWAEAIARAAIKAMREPTEAMCDAGDTAIKDGLIRAVAGLPPKDSDHASREVWQAMIDEALRE